MLGQPPEHTVTREADDTADAQHGHGCRHASSGCDGCSASWSPLVRKHRSRFHRARTARSTQTACERWPPAPCPAPAPRKRGVFESLSPAQEDPAHLGGARQMLRWPVEDRAPGLDDEDGHAVCVDAPDRLRRTLAQVCTSRRVSPCHTDARLPNDRLPEAARYLRATCPVCPSTVLTFLRNQP